MRSTQQGQWRQFFFGPGTAYPVTAIEGIDALSGIRTVDIDRPQQDGNWTGTDQVDARTIILSLGIQGTDPADVACETRGPAQHRRRRAVQQHNSRFLDAGKVNV